jgi:hypothetical protein
VIDADQAGNGTYQPAIRVPRTVVLAYSSSGFTAPLPKSTLIKSGSTVPVKFKLTTAHGRPIPAGAASALASSGAVTVTLTGPGISAVMVICTWDSSGAQFQWPTEKPSGLKTGTSNPYTISAYQSVTAASGGTAAVRVTSEKVFFK